MDGHLFSRIKADLYCCIYLFLQTYSVESISGYLTERLFVALAGGLLFHLLLNSTFMAWKKSQSVIMHDKESLHLFGWF